MAGDALVGFALGCGAQAAQEDVEALTLLR
jgi:hypothetical protein